jgi:protoporphyrin/coproporphyrin ferrochelatase
MSGERIAVVLFNLGGPDSLDAVEPFLTNLFSDKAIIGLPSPWRGWLARLIARRRAPVARVIYEQMGGRSPLRELTEAQAAALQEVLRARGVDVHAFVCMRYWHPMSEETAARVARLDPERIVLLPLYPQFSSTTTGSSLTAWLEATAAVGLSVPTLAVCCYPCQRGLIETMAARIETALASLDGSVPRRILFSAHGLPQRIVDRGDPYPWQVEQTVAAIVDRLGPAAGDHVLCYQSRVGPLKWIGPSTEAEIKRAGRDGRAAVVVPVAFVSEHSETLVELDIEYRHLAETSGVLTYVRVPTAGTEPGFIDGLADLVEEAMTRDGGPPRPEGGRRLCAPGLSQCVCSGAPATQSTPGTR